MTAGEAVLSLVLAGSTSGDTEVVVVPEDVAALAGCSVEEAQVTLDELIKLGVADPLEGGQQSGGPG